jgi:acetyl esterase/lipase
VNRQIQLLILSALIGCANVARAEASEAQAAATPFYVWQEELTQKPGALLRQEPLEEELVIEEASRGVRILYASHGWDDQLVAVSGEILLPKGSPPEGGWPVLAWSHGTLGVADICAPSFKGRSERDRKYHNKWLAEGYAIVSTDYEGLGTPGGHTYLHCKSEANGNIDAVQAVHQLGLNLSKRWLVFGQSQGGQGALCTGAYAGASATDLDFRGTLATAPAVNWKERFMAGRADDPNPFIAFSLLLGRGFEAFEPTFEIEETFSAKAMELMPLTDSLCIGDLMGVGMQANLNQGESLKVFPIGKGPGVMAAAEKMEVPLTGWSGEPVYIGQGSADPLVPFSDVLSYSSALCEQGIAVTLDVYEGAGHSGPLNQGFDAFSAWVADRFADKPADNNCHKINEHKN